MLTAPTGLHHEDQKLIYKDKERDSKTFLDFVGVKDKSKMVVLEDPISREKRLIEARKNAKSAKAAKLILDISVEVDRLAGQVAEKMVFDLIELLMNQLLKLDEIKVDGDVNQQKKLQQEASRKKTSEGVVVTTQWETFDSLPTVFSATPSTSNTGETIQHNFNWDMLFFSSTMVFDNGYVEQVVLEICGVMILTFGLLVVEVVVVQLLKL
ncbi:hypothetical protein L1987_71114 [Smallanthus sonchifolius]|uniref:Uncharacterized protein n=1 Tax=Smallanthus sonchifolius TaxID=185202 RepID=A0ACB9AVU5_9ASTR|nr:hypothetical protein L1987_71114 [Smallanthus sonchifolius]